MHVDAESIRQKFNEFGRIFDVLLKDGYAFIQFENETSAEDAVREMNRTNVFGNGNINVEFAKINNEYKSKKRRLGGYRSLSEDSRDRDREKHSSSWKPSRNHVQGKKSPRLFLGRISLNVSDDDIRREFRKYGRIVDITLKSNYAFVHFDTADEAENALEDCHRANVFG